MWLYRSHDSHGAHDVEPMGAMGRHVLTVQIEHWFGSSIPWATLVVNVFGSFLLGVLYEAGTAMWQPTVEFKAFLTIGLLGAFTTFSTFSMDVVILAERGAWFTVGVYVIGSVSMAVLGLVLGMAATRGFLA